MEESLTQQSLESRIVSFCLHKPCYDRVKNMVTKDMFEGDWSRIWAELVDTHSQYDNDISVDELHASFESNNPTLTPSAQESYLEYFCSLNDETGNNWALQEKIIRDFYLRHQARIVGEKAVNIFLGKERGEGFGELKKLIETAADQSVLAKTSYREVDADLSQLLDMLTLDPDFLFDWEPVTRRVKGLDRGHFGIIFARPETGKTTFVSFLAQKFIRQGHVVAVWGNEEPAERTKLRIIQSYFQTTKEVLAQDREQFTEEWNRINAGKLRVLDCVGTTIQEIDDWCKINKPDIVFIDQLDKVKIGGKFNRGDEKLKEIYLQAREIAKRNKCLVWGVSQASAEAEGMRDVEYQYLDNSKTGKAGEADLIIGLGRTSDHSPENTKRFVCISKNKQNGWHGTIPVEIDMYRAVYESNNTPIVIPTGYNDLIEEPEEDDFDG